MEIQARLSSGQLLGSAMSGLYGSGEQALFALPGDGRPHIRLSSCFYDWRLKRVRADFAANRSGVAIVEVAIPINAPILLVTLDRQSLYHRVNRKTTALTLARLRSAWRLR